VHTAFDGDTVFAVSTGGRPADDTSLLLLQTAAVEVIAQAIRAAVPGS
jgi:L-aminopeptidase/D-esterase-like protein